MLRLVSTGSRGSIGVSCLARPSPMPLWPRTERVNRLAGALLDPRDFAIEKDR